MAVEGAVTALLLCRSIIAQVCDPGLGCRADPGVKVPN